ncbi:MAG: hypothetical protein KAI79_12725, partial [Bacteroidales bacterium]|nr:hypothetical protein [Bacteroidales bacterium]
MALNINGRMKVKTLKSDFIDEFGLTLRVYDGRSFAADEATLASIRKGDRKGGEFAPRKNTKVGNLEEKIKEMFGIKTQVAGSDDSYLCDNGLTLTGALESDERLMVKRTKRVNDDVEREAEVLNEIKPVSTHDSVVVSMSLDEIIEELKSTYSDHENLDEMISDLEDESYFGHWATKLCEDEFSNNIGLAQKLI